MENIIIDDYIKTDSEKNILENIISELKEKINNNVIYSNSIYLYFKTLYNKKNKIYDKLLIHCFYKKNQKNKNEYLFDIILSDNFNYNVFPKIYCKSLDIDKNINFIDKRDLFYAIMEKNYDEIIIKNIIDLLLDIIIIKIPEFVKKIFFYKENKIFIYYGKYYLNELYNINDFICNKNIYFYRVMTYKRDKNKEYIQLNMKYVIVSDFYVLFFDLVDDNSKNMCKLIFIGEIFKINSFERLEAEDKSNNDENDDMNISQDKVYIDWISYKHNKRFKFIFSVIYDKNNQEKIHDFIDVVYKKQAFIGINYKIIIKDYNEFNNEQEELNELINLSKYLEKKEKYIGNLDIYIKEMKNIYNKIIEIANKINKDEISLEYTEKIKIINKKDNIYNKNINLYSFDEKYKLEKINSIFSLNNLYKDYK